jgi:hypothetical protein
MVEVEIEIEIKIWANKVKMTSLIHFNILHKAEGPTLHFRAINRTTKECVVFLAV